MRNIEEMMHFYENQNLTPVTPDDPKLTFFIVLSIAEVWCGQAWQKYNDKCFLLEHTARVTFLQAKADCSARDAMLATITSQGEQDYLAGIVMLGDP